MQLNYTIQNNKVEITLDSGKFQFTLDYPGLRMFNNMQPTHYPDMWTKAIRKEFVRSILGCKEVISFIKESGKITLPQFNKVYNCDQLGLLQFKHDFRDQNDIFDTFEVRLAFVSKYVGTYEALTIPNIARIVDTSDWANLMTNGLDWDLLNDETIWIPEVSIIHDLIMEAYQAEVMVLSTHLPLVPQFKNYRMAENSLERMAPPLILLRGNCCVGKTSLLLQDNGVLPILQSGNSSYREFLDGVIAGDKFKKLLQPWLFDGFDHDNDRVEGLVHTHGLTLCDHMLNLASKKQIPVIIDNRLLCPSEIQRISQLFGRSFATVIIDIDGDIEDLLERSKNRPFPRVEESVIVSGNSQARNERCVLLNSKYSVYFFKSKGIGRSIIRTFVSECHDGYHQVHDNEHGEIMMPGLSFANKNPVFAAMNNTLA